jgi:hypothetical protein
MTSLTVNVAARNNRTMLTGTAICSVLGAGCVALGVLAGGSSLSGTLYSTGAFFLVLAVVPLVRARTVLRRRQFVLDAEGIRWDDHKGGWAAAWQELGLLSISTSRQVRDQQTTASTSYGAPVGVDLEPADQEFRGRHPEMEHLWADPAVHQGYRIPLDPDPDLIPKLDQAFRKYAPAHIYCGIIQEPGYTV